LQLVDCAAAPALDLVGVLTSQPGHGGCNQVEEPGFGIGTADRECGVVQRGGLREPGTDSWLPMSRVGSPGRLIAPLDQTGLETAMEIVIMTCTATLDSLRAMLIDVMMIIGTDYRLPTTPVSYA
jgi:hypothetical protein